MPAILTPIPKTAVAVVRRMFAGTWGRVLWKLLVLVGGGFLVLYTVTTTSSYLVLAVVGIVITIALSSTVRRIILDIWFRRFFRL